MTAQPSVQTYNFAEDAPWFGGFSAIEVSQDGLSFVALSDRDATLIRGTFDRTGGRIVGHSVTQHLTLKDPSGQILPEEERDFEGLDWTPQTDEVFVSREWDHRVLRVENGLVFPLDSISDAAGFAPNAGLESLARDWRGQLFTLPERSGAWGTPFPVFRWNSSGWSQVASLPRSGGFLPTGADFAPDGRLWVLERAFDGLAFRTRIRSLDIATGEVATLFRSGVGQFGNLEGLSIRKLGQTWVATLITDDNFRGTRGSEIVELTFPLGKPATNP